MSKKLDKLIKRLKEAKDILNKDDVDEKIKAKLLAEMKRRNFTEADATRHVIDRDRGAKMPKPKKPKEPLLQSESPEIKLQKAMTEAARNLLSSEKKTEEPKKSALDLADSLVKSLEKAAGADKPVQVKKPAPTGPSATQLAEQQVMQKLAKTVGAMMPQNAKLQPTQEEFEAAMIAQGMAFTPEQLEKMDKDWGNTMSDFFREASKPISKRFNSPEEEEAYWASIKVNAGGDNGPGY